MKKLKKNAKVNTEKKAKTVDRAKTAKYLKFGAIGAAILTVIIIASVFTVSYLNDEGIIIRSKTVKKSEDLSVNGAMFTYIFWDNFKLSLAGDYGYYYKLQGISSSNDLYLENPNEKGKTWWDHFADMAEETTTAMLAYAQYALDNGKGLTDADQKLIDEEMQNMENTAYVMGMSLDDYLSKNYGRGVKAEDVRDVLELMCLSNNGSSYMYESLTPTDSEIDKYFETNNNDLKKADYYFFVLGISGKNNLTPEQEKYFSDKAEDIKQSSSAEEFKSKISAYLTEYNASLKDGDEKKLTNEQLKEYIESELKSMEYMNDVYADTLEVDRWIFDSSRVVGDTYVNHEDGYGTYGVVYIIKPVYIDSKWRDLAKENILKDRVAELMNTLKTDRPVKLNKLVKAIAHLD